MSDSPDGLVPVRTTMRPDDEIRVTPHEYRDLAAQNLLVPADADIQALIDAACAAVQLPDVPAPSVSRKSRAAAAEADAASKEN